MVLSRWVVLPALLLSAAPGFASVASSTAALAAVPRAILSAPSMAGADLEPARKDRPFQFAVRIATDLQVRDGQWDDLANGQRRWRLRVDSPGALSLSLHFAPFDLPASATVWIRSLDGAVVHGPYRIGHATTEGLWTPIVPGAGLVVEAQLDASDAPQLQLGIADAYHGYREWSAVPTKSGSCNIDTACTQGDDWREPIRSTARISFSTSGGSTLCSGQLLNNVRQDKAPLFLTAYHCGIRSASHANSAVFYFNYAAPACGGPRASLATADTLNSSALLAGDAPSDFTLLRITDPRPLPANAYFAGWDASGDGANSGASIHHPSGDDKAISLFDTPVVPSSQRFVGESCDKFVWDVRWSAGTTETGSSGGALYNASRRVIGVLSGGEASCSNPTAPDFYARLERAWTASLSDPARQLKAHLDPDDSCIAAIDGLEFSAVNPQPIADGIRLCQGPTSVSCSPPVGTVSSGGSGGALGSCLLAPLLLGLALRTRA